MKKTILVLVFLSTTVLASKAEKLYSLKLSMPISMATVKNAVDRPSIEFGGGVGADIWLYRRQNFFIGAGSSLHSTAQPLNGTNTVNISPYTLYAEARLTMAYGIFGYFAAILPYIGLNHQIGSLITKTQVLDQSSINADLFLAFAPHVGMQYLFDRYGLSVEYSMAFSSRREISSLRLAFLFLL